MNNLLCIGRLKTLYKQFFRKKSRYVVHVVSLGSRMRPGLFYPIFPIPLWSYRVALAIAKSRT